MKRIIQKGFLIKMRLKKILVNSVYAIEEIYNINPKGYKSKIC